MSLDPSTTAGQVAKALGRIPSGCAILTSAFGDTRTGMLASWVQQAGFEPPMFSVAVKKGRPITKLIDESGGFVVNMLGENPTPMFKHFGKGFSIEEDAFAGLSVIEKACGVVIDDQIAWLAAKVRSRCDAGDHWLYIGEAVEAGGGEAAPYVHIRKNGLSY